MEKKREPTLDWMVREDLGIDSYTELCQSAEEERDKNDSNLKMCKGPEAGKHSSPSRSWA